MKDDITYSCSNTSPLSYKASERNVFFFFSFYGLGLMACSNSKLPSEIINQFRHLIGLLGRVLSPMQGKRILYTEVGYI
jgi:hypothetical protein